MSYIRLSLRTLHFQPMCNMFQYECTLTRSMNAIWLKLMNVCANDHRTISRSLSDNLSLCARWDSQLSTLRQAELATSCAQTHASNCAPRHLIIVFENCTGTYSVYVTNYKSAWTALGVSVRRRWPAKPASSVRQERAVNFIHHFTTTCQYASNLVSYAQSTSTVIAGRSNTK